jgi:hypothetical protein
MQKVLGSDIQIVLLGFPPLLSQQDLNFLNTKKTSTKDHPVSTSIPASTFRNCTSPADAVSYDSQRAQGLFP